MDLELRKITHPDGNSFYQVLKDGWCEKSFWIGDNTGAGHGDEKALDMAKRYYAILKENPQSTIETIQSEKV